MTNHNGPKISFSKNLDVSAGDSVSLVWNANHPVTGEPLEVRPVAEVDQNLAQDHAAFAEMEMDLLDAATTLESFPKFSNETDADIRRALYTEAVVSYCRPFNKGFGRGQQLTCSAPWILDEEIEKKRHAEIVSIRDKVIAHSDRNSPFRSVASYSTNQTNSQFNVKVCCAQIDRA
jgi:hypothetical protein